MQEQSVRYGGAGGKSWLCGSVKRENPHEFFPD